MIMTGWRIAFWICVVGTFVDAAARLAGAPLPAHGWGWKLFTDLLVLYLVAILAWRRP